MDTTLKTLFLDAHSGYYRIERYPLGSFFGPVDLGLYLSSRYNSLNIGTGIFAGSIFPGSNRLIVTGNSPCWGGFYISSMGGAGLIFDNLGINLLSIIGKAISPSILYLNRVHGEEIEVKLHPVDLFRVWSEGNGIYSLIEHTHKYFSGEFTTDPRILAVGPAALTTDIGAIGSVPIKNGVMSPADTWAGRGGFGSKMLIEHGIAAIIYGGTYIDEDFRDRKVADQWFQNKYNKKMAVKDFEATQKYRFDPDLDTGGTFGVNYAKVAGRIIAFNYRSIYYEENQRLALHADFIVNHYLKQFNDEIIKPKGFSNCGEPCAAVCKKISGEFKKDYEPYQTMGPLCGIFDQRAAEKLVHRADALGFDTISIGGVLAWIMECVSEGLITADEAGIDSKPVFSPDGFAIESDSAHNAAIGLKLLDAIVQRRGILSMGEGARKFSRRLSRERGRKVIDTFIYTANGRNGWMVPNQYWTPGVLAPMPIMGKYYMYYGEKFYPPRELGRECANRMLKELILDNTGFCRFHRNWAEDQVPEIIEQLYAKKEQFLGNNLTTAVRINCRNAGIYWKSERAIDLVHTFIRRQHDIENDRSETLIHWLDYFNRDKRAAAFDFWFEISKGISETLKEF